MKLILGSAQFGLDYGITNQRGKISRDEAYNILNYAKENGVSMIDTAVAYGDSEQVLGKICSKIEGFDFISKLQLDCNNNTRDVSRTIDGSCMRLGVESLYGLMVHNADVLLTSEFHDYWYELIRLKQQGKIKKVGVSVYSPEQVDVIIEKFDIDIIQIPVNLLDQRFLKFGILKNLKKKNIEIHVRSVFLQGLLLSDFSKIDDYFNPILPKFQAIDEICQSNNLTKLDLIFEFLKSIQYIDAVVFGVTAMKEIEEVVAAFNREPSEGLEVDFSRLSVADESYINPKSWPDK